MSDDIDYCCDDDYEEPVESCAECGVSLYEDEIYYTNDDEPVCGQCSWMLEYA